MKRTISMFGALAFAAGFFLAAPAANAAPCTTTYPTGAQLPSGPPPNTPAKLNEINDWPKVKELNSNPAISSLYYCANGTASTDAQFTIVWTAAQTIGHHGLNAPPQYVANLFYQNKLRVYFFENLTALNAAWGTNYPAVVGGGEPAAVTLGAGDPHDASVPVGSVGILRKRANGTGFLDNTLRGNTYHELGHAFDRLRGYPSSTGTSRWMKPASQGGILNTNEVNLNLLSRATAFGMIHAATKTGCETQYNDEVTYSNWAVAQCIWPYQTDAGHTNSFEFYANVFAVVVGGLLWDQADNQKLYDLSNFIAGNFQSDVSGPYFTRGTAPLGVVYGGTP